MASLFGLCALGILMMVSATIYATGRNHIATAHRFLARDALRNAAEDGVLLAVAWMNEDAATAAKASGAVSHKAPLLRTKVGDASVEVFARNKGNEILLMSVGKQEKERARAVGAVKKNAGTYMIVRWER